MILREYGEIHEYGEATYTTKRWSNCNFCAAHASHDNFCDSVSCGNMMLKRVNSPKISPNGGDV